VKYKEKLVNELNKYREPKEPYIFKLMLKYTLEQNKLDEENMRIHTDRQMPNDHIYGQISNNCCLSYAFKFNLGHKVKLFVVEMMRATGKEIAKRVIKPAKVIPASCIQATCQGLLCIIDRQWKVLKWLEQMREKRKICKRIIHVLM
jgi:hypothetical protein